MVPSFVAKHGETIDQALEAGLVVVVAFNCPRLTGRPDRHTRWLREHHRDNLQRHLAAFAASLPRVAPVGSIVVDRIIKK